MAGILDELYLHNLMRRVNRPPYQMEPAPFESRDVQLFFQQLKKCPDDCEMNRLWTEYEKQLQLFIKKNYGRRSAFLDLEAVEEEDSGADLNQEDEDVQIYDDEFDLEDPFIDDSPVELELQTEQQTSKSRKPRKRAKLVEEIEEKYHELGVLIRELTNKLK